MRDAYIAGPRPALCAGGDLQANSAGWCRHMVARIATASNDNSQRKQVRNRLK